MKTRPTRKTKKKSSQRLMDALAVEASTFHPVAGQDPLSTGGDLFLRVTVRAGIEELLELNNLPAAGPHSGPWQEMFDSVLREGDGMARPEPKGTDEMK
jgi:hypothetical protein